MNRAAVALAVVLTWSFATAEPARKPELSEADAAKLRHAASLLDAYRGDDAKPLEAAHSELDEVVEANPRYAPAWRELARYRMMSGHTGGAEFAPGALEGADEALARAIASDPGYAAAYVLRGQLYRLMKRPDDAVAALKKAESLGSHDPWLHNNWADLLLDEGKFTEAAEHYRKVADDTAAPVKARLAATEGLIEFYLDGGDLDRADGMFRSLIALEPGSARGHTAYAQFLLCQREDYEGAIARARDGLRVENQDAARYWLAAALYRRWAQAVVVDGKPDAGKASFAEAQAIFPGVEEVAANAATCPALDFVAQALSRQAAADVDTPTKSR
ncbi:MAG TPA: tetratricopeptide repeat protein [Dokdonella sp.]|nr:tetratricopeptide repeat protein [Dokdonella sp.]